LSAAVDYTEIQKKQSIHQLLLPQFSYILRYSS
jgi:hypothetical protein